MVKKTDVIQLVGFALGGHTEYSGGAQISGYRRPENWVPDPDRVYLWDCPVVDKRQRLEEYPHLALASPMCDPRLSDGVVERCPDPAGTMVGQAVMADPGNAFGVLARAQIASRRRGAEPGPLDSVSVADYVRWWKARGARVGRVVDCAIVWEPLPGELAAATPAPEQSELF